MLETELGKIATVGTWREGGRSMSNDLKQPGELAVLPFLYLRSGIDRGTEQLVNAIASRGTCLLFISRLVS